MRVFFTFPFLGRTRMGVSVSDRELLGGGWRRHFLIHPAVIILLGIATAFFIIVGALLFALILSPPAGAGTCRHGSYGGSYVVSCDNGSVTVRRNGRITSQWGIPNAGFERYPGMGYGNYPARDAHYPDR